MNSLSSKKLFAVAVFSLVFVAFLGRNVMATNAAPESPVKVEVGALLPIRSLFNATYIR